MLTQLIKPLFFSAAIIIILFIISRNIGRKKDSLKREMITVGFIIYISWVLAITLYPVPMTLSKTTPRENINLVPVINTVKEFKVSMYSQRRHLQINALENLLGNVLLFVPFGILMPLISGIRTFWSILFAALLFSLGIETAQLLLKYIGVYRTVDIDDVILNVSGAVLGFLAINFVERWATGTIKDE